MNYSFIYVLEKTLTLRRCPRIRLDPSIKKFEKTNTFVLFKQVMCILEVFAGSAYGCLRTSFH